MFQARGLPWMVGRYTEEESRHQGTGKAHLTTVDPPSSCDKLGNVKGYKGKKEIQWPEPKQKKEGRREKQPQHMGKEVKLSKSTHLNYSYPNPNTQNP